MLKKRQLSVVFCMVIVGIGIGSSILEIESTPIIQEHVVHDPVNILLLMDEEWGANYLGIITKFEMFGWNITIAGPSATITSCVYNGYIGLDVDILLTDVNDIYDITQFDCLNIMPGSSHENLLGNQDIRDMINSAVDNGLVVSAWCRAVRVLADADVIAGLNVTGHIDYKTEYEAAGATFFSSVPPITQGKIVTGVRSRFYQSQMCIAIAKALGVHETDPPTIKNLIIENLEGLKYNISVELEDVTPVMNAKIVLNALTEVKINDYVVTKFVRTLARKNGGNVFENTIDTLPNGIYSADIETEDGYYNSKTYINVTTINTLNSDSAPAILVVGTVSTFTIIAIFTRIVARRKR
ncbi:MAG: DJ-1/PfpI family protein [Candidatus Heimdallarchaeota archaeon]